MIEIVELTNDYKQELYPTLETGQTFKFSLEFVEMQASWYCSIQYGNTEINNIRVCLTDNLLYNWKNILPFGLLIISSGTIPQQQDPYSLDDFTKRVKIFILNETEVQEFDSL